MYYFFQLRNEILKWLLPYRSDVKNKHDIFFYEKANSSNTSLAVFI